MPDRATLLIAQITECLRALNFDRHQDAYDAATCLRRAAERIEHAAAARAELSHVRPAARRQRSLAC